MERNQEMSSLAHQRMTTMLPELLGAVRGRRRRRVAARVAMVAAMLALLVSYWPGMGGQARDSKRPGSDHSSQMANVRDGGSSSGMPFACEVVRDVPGIVERYRGTSSKHEQWFVGDDELQDFLRKADRPEGLVRVAGKVVVASAALDPFPVLDAE